MPVYRASKNRWRIRIWSAGRRQDWIVHGSKSDAEAFEARKRVEIEATGVVERRVVPTFSSFCVDTYKPHAKVHLRATTWSTRRYHLATLIEHLGHLKLTAIGAPQIEAFKQARLAAGVKPISVNNELAVYEAVRSYARHLHVPVAEGQIKKLPVKEKSRLLVWSKDDVHQLLTCCAKISASLVPLVVFLANTGCRCGEALALTWSDVDLAARMVRITPSEEWQSKSGKPREIPISDDLLGVLQALPRRCRHVFATRAGERYACWPKREFNRARDLARLKGGPHTLRHTFASHFLKQVPDLFLLARVLGHSDTRVTKLYSHLLPEHLARARNAVSFAAPTATPSATEKAASRWNVGAHAVTIDAETVPATVPAARNRKR
jgi:integrase